MRIEEEPGWKQGDRLGGYPSSSGRLMLAISRAIGKKVD